MKKSVLLVRLVLLVQQIHSNLLKEILRQ